MNHLMETMNPEAATVADREREPLPQVGQAVRYRPRPGERRAGRIEFPALVMRVDEDNRHLDLTVFYDADDFAGLRAVPEHAGDDRGWIRLADDSEVAQRLAAFKDEVGEALFGNSPTPQVSILEQLMSLKARADTAEQALEKALNRIAGLEQNLATVIESKTGKGVRKRKA